MDPAELQERLALAVEARRRHLPPAAMLGWEFVCPASLWQVLLAPPEAPPLPAPEPPHPLIEGLSSDERLHYLTIGVFNEREMRRRKAAALALAYTFDDITRSN